MSALHARRSRSLLALLLPALLAAAACSDDAGGGAPGGTPGADTTALADLPFVPTPDAAGPDAATPDTAAPPDAGPDDTAAPPEDTGAADTGAPDTAAPADTAAPDTAAADTAPAPDQGKPGLAQLEVDPASYTFSYISPLSAPLTRQFTLANLGGAAVSITKLSIEPAGSDFAFVVVPPLPKVVDPGKTTMVHVRFSEGTGAPATLRIESNDPARPVIEVPLASYLKATVSTPEPCAQLVPSSLAFGQVVRGNTKTLQTVLKNCSADAPLKLTNITRSAFLFIPLTEEFQVTPMPAFPTTVPPGGTLPLAVSYQPKLAGPDAGYFLLHTDDPAEPKVQLDVSGIGVAPPEEELGLTVKLAWDADLSDVDSHLIAPGGAFFDCTTDCFFGNPAPDWGVQGDWIDDPFLDVDDVDGFGPEHINISEPQPGTYTYKVHYWRDNYEDSWSTDTNATVQLLSYGQVIATFGPTWLDKTDRTWDVFQIAWPSGQVTPLGNTWMVPSGVPTGCGFNGLFP